LSSPQARAKSIYSKINWIDFWKGANHGKQGTRQEQGKEKEEERKAGTTQVIVSLKK
jgi:hypothetical protein